MKFQKVSFSISLLIEANHLCPRLCNSSDSDNSFSCADDADLSDSTSFVGLYDKRKLQLVNQEFLFLKVMAIKNFSLITHIGCMGSSAAALLCVTPYLQKGYKPVQKSTLPYLKGAKVYVSLHYRCIIEIVKKLGIDYPSVKKFNSVGYCPTVSTISQKSFCFLRAVASHMVGSNNSLAVAHSVENNDSSILCFKDTPSGYYFASPSPMEESCVPMTHRDCVALVFQLNNIKKSKKRKSDGMYISHLKFTATNPEGEPEPTQHANPGDTFSPLMIFFFFLFSFFLVNLRMKREYHEKFCLDGILTNTNDLKEAVTHQRTTNSFCLFHQVSDTKLNQSGAPETLQRFTHPLHAHYLGIF